MAQDEVLKNRTLSDLRRMLDYRKMYDSRRSLFYRQYVGQRDPQKFPDNTTNRSNTFVPYPLSNVETIVSRTSDAFFSFAPFFEVDGTTQFDDSGAEAMQLVLDVKLREAGFQNQFEQYVRNVAIYGHAGLKIDWNWDYKTLTKPEPIYVMDPQNPQMPLLDPNSGQPIVRGYQPVSYQVPVNCPRVTAIDIYDLLIDPDGSVVAHLNERQLGTMLREQEMYRELRNGDLWDPDALAKLQADVTQAYSEKGDPNSVLIRFAEVWNRGDNSMTVITFGDDSDAIAWKDQRASYRSGSYSTYRLPVWTGSGEILRTGDNPFAHKRIPILYTSYIKLPNEIYGLGAIEITSDLTESLNRMTNMITDNWNLGVNRRYAYDENADIDHEALNQMNVPGGKVAVNGNPNDVLSPLPMFTPSAGDYQILTIYKGMQEMASGVSDFYQQGVGSSGGNRTATGISSVINESNYRFKLFIRNLEVDVLTPMLEMCSSMCSQFLTDVQEVAITNAAPGIPKWYQLDPAKLIGNYKFHLVAANYATNKTVRQRNLMAFMQQAQQTPYWRQGEGLRELGKVLEIHNINELIKSDQEVQMEQQQEQQHEMQMSLLQKVVDVEGKTQVAKARHPGEGQAASGGQAKAKEGRPAKAQTEGKIPGQTEQGITRSEGQQSGANALGLEGLGAA
jgi:hypothetical protein